MNRFLTPTKKNLNIYKILSHLHLNSSVDCKKRRFILKIESNNTIHTATTTTTKKNIRYPFELKLTKNKKIRKKRTNEKGFKYVHRMNYYNSLKIF